LIERTDATAEASFAAMRERRRLGMAIAATTRMTATTINNSISEKPASFERTFVTPSDLSKHRKGGNVAFFPSPDGKARVKVVTDYIFKSVKVDFCFKWSLFFTAKVMQASLGRAFSDPLWIPSDSRSIIASTV
jgi:hypothetical protein